MLLQLSAFCAAHIAEAERGSVPANIHTLNRGLVRRSDAVYYKMLIKAKACVLWVSFLIRSSACLAGFDGTVTFIKTL